MRGGASMPRKSHAQKSASNQQQWQQAIRLQGSSLQGILAFFENAATQVAAPLIQPGRTREERSRACPKKGKGASRAARRPKTAKPQRKWGSARACSYPFHQHVACRRERDAEPNPKNVGLQTPISTSNQHPTSIQPASNQHGNWELGTASISSVHPRCVCAREGGILPTPRAKWSKTRFCWGGVWGNVAVQSGQGLQCWAAQSPLVGSESSCLVLVAKSLVASAVYSANKLPCGASRCGC